MAKNDNPQGGNTGPSVTETTFDEAALAGMTDEQLSEIANAYEIATESATKEEIISAILKAQEEKENSAGAGGDQGNGTPPEEKPEGPPKIEPNTGGDNAPSGDGEVSVFSEKRKGKTITAVTGKPIVFDADGRAKVSQADADYLKTLPGFEVK
jgi:hypothetical protein